jgi:MYXO-CTERM domain-containing protein
VHTNTDGATCTDANPCTQNDQCAAGVCVPGTALDCPPSDECHESGTCDTTSGTCSNPAKKDGAACTGGSCKNAKCVSDGSGATSAGGAAGDGTGATGPGEGGAPDGGGSGGTISGGGTGAGTTGGTVGDVGGNEASQLYSRNPGGCACRTGTGQRGGTSALIGLALAAFALQRRRRKA